MKSMRKGKNGFYPRGLEITRLDTFLDAAFAFATTMIVISIGDIPGSYDELMDALKGIPAFVASFASILTFWMGHRKWSRAYGIENQFTTVVSLGLIFVLLVFVYPLKLVFTALFAWISNGWIRSDFVLRSSSELASLFVIYGLGFAAMAGMMALLYFKALRANLEPELDDIETVKTKSEINSWVVLALTGLASAVFAMAMPVRLAVLAGFVYATLPITMPVVSTMYKRKERALSSNY